MKKAFTLVEIMIVVVIIGLLAAMIVPIHIRVKTNDIAKRVYMGNTVSREEYEYLQRNITMVNAEYLARRTPIEAEPQVMPDASANTMTIIVNGKRYKLVPE